MKEKRKRNILRCVLILCFTILIGNTGTFAADVTILPTDQEHARDGNIMVRVDGSFLQIGDGSADVLRMINLIRYTACREGDWVPDEYKATSTSKKLSLARDYGETPTDAQLSEKNGDYVPAKWSAELERIAEIRAAEASIVMAHLRPNSCNEESTTMIVNGFGFYAVENLAWSSWTINNAVNVWLSERKAYKNQSTSSSSVGHYGQMIKMSNTYMAIAGFYVNADMAGTRSSFPYAISLIAAHTPEKGSGYPEERGGYPTIINTIDYTMSENPRSLSGKYSQLVEVSASRVKELTINGASRLCPSSTETLVLLANMGKGSCWTVHEGITWSSSDSSVVRIDGDGSIHALKEGKAVITASVGTLKSSREITVAHNWDAGKVTTEANCISEGKKTYICDECGKGKTEILPIDAGHHGETEVRGAVDAACEAEGYTGDMTCIDCNTIVEKGKTIPPAGHTEEVLSKQDPTCTESGLTEGKRCTVCDQMLIAQESIPAMGHSEEEIPCVEPTCTETGLTDGVKCSVCGEIFKIQEEIPATGHSEEELTGMEPTCTDSGLSTGSKCAVCDETLNPQITIPPLGHHEETLPGKVGSCTEDGLTEGAICTVCGAIIKQQEVIPAAHTIVTDKAVPESCTQDGLSEGQHCFVCGVVIVKQETVNATGHREAVDRAVEAAAQRTGLTEGSHCAECGTVLREQQIIPALDEHKEVLPTEITGEITPTSPAAAQSVVSQILSARSDADPKGSGFVLLQAKGSAASSTSVKLSWKKITGAKQYIIYGNKCGKNNRYQKITTVRGTSFTQKKLKKGTYYKYLVVAVSGDKALAASKTIHVATKGGKAGNTKKVTVSRSSVSIKVRKTSKIKAKTVAASSKLKVKKHRALAYESSDAGVATVSKKGVIKGISKGKCYVYVYAQNGVCAKVKVTVK